MVSRETPPPVAAAVVFGSSLPAAERYAQLLAGPAVRRGLIGPGELPRLWERHLLNCAVVAPSVPTSAAVCDVGSGAGLPGIVWALLRPDLRITLLEPSLRRVDFCREAVRTLGLGHVSVVRGRADGDAGPMSYDVVTARAVAPLDRLAAWAMPLCRPGGELVAFKGASAQSELASTAPTLSALGAAAWAVERWGEETLREPTTVIRVRAGGQVDA